MLHLLSRSLTELIIFGLCKLVAHLIRLHYCTPLLLHYTSAIKCKWCGKAILKMADIGNTLTVLAEDYIFGDSKAFFNPNENTNNGNINLCHQLALLISW